MFSHASIAPGVFLRLVSAFLITAMSALVHALATEVPVGQIIFWRSSVAVLPILAYAVLRRRFPGDLMPRNPRLHLMRGALGVFCMAMSFLSLAYLPVAGATALGFLAPVLSVPLAAWMLGEHLTRRVLFAVSLGFAGVLAMLWAAMELPEAGAVVGVAAGLAFALGGAFVRVHVKAMTATETATSIAFTFALTGTVAGLATAPFGWAPVQGLALVGLIGAGVLGGLAHIAATEAAARASVSALAAFDFTGMIWALGFDLLLFHNVPGSAEVIGTTAIVMAALLVTLRPRQVPAPPRGLLR